MDITNASGNIKGCFNGFQDVNGGLNLGFDPYNHGFLKVDTVGYFLRFTASYLLCTNVQSRLKYKKSTMDFEKK